LPGGLDEIPEAEGAGAGLAFSKPG
jgi:hypothetical protein